MDLHGLLAQIRDTYLSGRVMAFYVGSGISKDCPTHLPLGKDLNQAVISGFLERGGEKDLSLLRKVVNRRSLEEVCGVIQRELEDKRRLIRMMAQALDKNEIIPNNNHLFLARALRDGQLVVTTNFDAMVERAYHHIYGSTFPAEHISYDKPTFEQFLEQYSTSPFRQGANKLGWLLKLHGTFHLDAEDTHDSVRITLDRIGQGLPPKAEEALIEVLRNCPTVVLGYGCMDIDIIYPVLIRTDSLQPIWWVRHSDERTHICDYDQLKDILKEEESKNPRDINAQTLNIAHVLKNRGDRNNGKVWQINVLTCQVILGLMAQIGGNFGASMKPCAGRIDWWADELHQLGVEVSDVETLLVLANLAQACGPYKSDGRDIYDLSNELFQDVLLKVQDLDKKARILQEMGWNKYRQDPEKNTTQAVKLYDDADKLLLRDPTAWIRRTTIQSLSALAYRRGRRIDEALQAAKKAWKSLPSFIHNGDFPFNPNDLRTFLITKGINESNFGLLGSVLRRIAGVYDQCVSGSGTLATAITCEYCKYQWKMDEQEIRVLERARRLLETDCVLQQLAGEPLQKIQSENQLGLIYSKLGDGRAAVAVHERSCLMANQFNRLYEYAQALRNRALAEEVAGDLGKAISSLKEAMGLFEGRTSDLAS